MQPICKLILLQDRKGGYLSYRRLAPVLFELWIIVPMRHSGANLTFVLLLMVRHSPHRFSWESLGQEKTSLSSASWWIQQLLVAALLLWYLQVTSRRHATRANCPFGGKMHRGSTVSFFHQNIKIVSVFSLSASCITVYQVELYLDYSSLQVVYVCSRLTTHVTRKVEGKDTAAAVCCGCC